MGEFILDFFADGRFYIFLAGILIFGFFKGYKKLMYFLGLFQKGGSRVHHLMVLKFSGPYTFAFLVVAGFKWFIREGIEGLDTLDIRILNITAYSAGYFLLGYCLPFWGTAFVRTFDPDAEEETSSSKKEEVDGVPEANEIINKITAVRDVPDALLRPYYHVCAITYKQWTESDILEIDRDKFIKGYVDVFLHLYDLLPKNISTEGLNATVIDLFPDPKAIIQYLLYHTGVEPQNFIGRALTIQLENVDIYDKPVSPNTIPPWINNVNGGGKELVERFFNNQFIGEFLLGGVAISIPEEVRVEHHHIVGGTGHGKTQALQYLLTQDLNRDASIIVIDSQGDLIGNILKLDIPKERIVLLDPHDIEYPLALNLFDVGMDRINSYSALQRETQLNGIIELYDYVIGAILGAELTQKQGVAFRFVIRLLLHVPNATIHTLRDLFSPGGYERYEQYASKLSESGQAFFQNEFNTREFESTKQQVVRRLYGVLENTTFERMFSNPKSKVDIFKEMNEGKIILINTAKDLLKETGSEILGRFFIAMIAQAAQERASISRGERQRTYLYIDEAQDYFDRNIATILEQARKYNLGLVLAHQSLGQLTDDVSRSIASNTSIKFAGGVSAKDARTLASDMRTTPEFIQAQGKLSFAAYVKGSTPSAISIAIEPGYMENMPQRSDMKALLAMTRKRYSTALDDLPTVEVIEKYTAPADPNKPAPKASKPKSQPKRQKTAMEIEYEDKYGIPEIGDLKKKT